MKKLIMSVFMVTSLCFLTVGFVRTVVAVPTISKDVTTLNDALAIETKQSSTTLYEFTIVYDNGGDTTDVIIKDTIPAEWNVIEINGITVSPVKDKDDPSLTDNSDSQGGTFTVFRSGKKSKGPKNKDNNSSTKIYWIPETINLTHDLTVKVETRRSPSGKPKYAPTSCGLFVLNPGATAFQYDPITGEIVLDSEEDPVVLAGPTDPLNLVAVEDVDNSGGVGADGTGDEDGDTLSDADEVLIHGTSPCSDDTDGDGLTDDYEVAIIGCPDPLNPDSDGDTLPDGFEENTYNTDPCLPDTDTDGCNDNLDTDPVNPGPDVDGDGVVGGCDADDDDYTVQ
jgi:hypothetical protein